MKSRRPFETCAGRAPWILCAVLLFGCGGTDDGGAGALTGGDATSSDADVSVAQPDVGLDIGLPEVDVAPEDAPVGTDSGPEDVADTAGATDGADVADGVIEDVAPMDVAEDTGAADAADADAPTDTDATAPLECSFPAPIVAGTAETDLLATSAGRCGQDDHSWIDDPSLGDVLAHTNKLSLTAETINLLIAGEGVVPPKPFEHDIVIDQILYTTQDRGALIEATAAIAYPADMDLGEPHDVLLLLHGTAGFNDGCAPSNDLTGQALAALFATWGFVAVAPDYIGMKGMGDPTGFPHPYLVGQATAIASLDAVRALAKLAPEQRGGACMTDRVLIFGGSQGGHAALWVDRLAPYYARELTLIGTVATVPPSDVLAHAERALTKLVSASANTLAILSTEASWYGADGDLSLALVAPYDTAVPEALAGSCSPGDTVEGFKALGDVFQPLLLDAAAAGTLADVSPWGCFFAENGLPTTSIPRIGPSDPSYGILVLLGSADTLVDPQIERDAIPKLCAQDMPVELIECAGAGHTATSLWGLPEALDFMDARAAGTPMNPEQTCTLSGPITCSGTPLDKR